MGISALEPKSLWEVFTQLNAIPRPSKKEQKVIEFVKILAKSASYPLLLMPQGM